MSDVPSGPPSDGPPPGWYPDPHGQPGYRWWNGVAWTDDRSVGETDQRGRLLPVGDMLGETFRVIGQRIGHLFTLAAVIMLAPTVLASVALYRAASGIRYEDGTWTGISAGDVVVLVVAGLATAVAQLVFTAAVNRHGMAAMAGTPEPWSDSVVGGLRRGLRVLWANVAVWLPVIVGLTVLVVLVAALAGAVAVVLIFAVPVVLVWVWVRAGLVTTAASLAPTGVGSIRTSFGLTKGHFWGFLGRFLLLAVLWWAVNTGGSIATGPVAGFAAAPPDDAIEIDDDTGELLRVDVDALIPSNPGVIGFSLVVTTLVQAAAGTVTALARVSLYRSLSGPVEESVGRDPVAEAQPGTWP
jgi:hypothetical protein